MAYRGTLTQSKQRKMPRCRECQLHNDNAPFTQEQVSTGPSGGTAGMICFVSKGDGLAMSYLLSLTRPL